MVTFFAQGFGALLVAVLALCGFRGGLSLRVRVLLALVLVVVWFALSPSFFSLIVHPSMTVH